MKNVPLEDKELDIAIFSLSLMGSNYKDYLLEASRCLKIGGWLFIANLTKHKISRMLVDDLVEMGYDIFNSHTTDGFYLIAGKYQPQ